MRVVLPAANFRLCWYPLILQVLMTQESTSEEGARAPVAGSSSMATETLDADTTADRWVDLQFTWAGKAFKLTIADSDRVFDLKTSLRDLTKVPIERQKILGLVKGKLPPDQARVADLGLTPGKKFSLIGTPEGDEIKDPSKLESLPDVVNDLDVDFTENMAASNRYQHDARNIRKVKEMTAKLNVNIITPLRPGKRLLVLDIDYTILDTKPLTSGSLPPSECARPYLHEFLEAIYPYYDICIWSQTSWIWLETKLVELGMIGSDKNYHVSPPPLFASRNFALNPKEGIKIHAFKNAHTSEAMADRELEKLTRYLLHITSFDDFRTIAHKVFPGGNFDKKQDSSLAITAIRETFEESGLLLASSSADSSVMNPTATVSEKVLDEERFAIHQQQKLFQDFLSEHNLRPDVAALMPFTEWITPVGPPKRFRTQFFVTFLTPSPSSGFSSGKKQERLPTPDGGQEVIAARFIHPAEALEEHKAQKMSFMPPQFYILSTLAEILKGSVNTAEQREQVEALSGGAFGKLVINPLAIGKDDTGRQILAYEGDEGRGGPKGRLHRAMVQFGKGTVAQITLVRNFDIFKDIEPATFNTPSSKL
ncbi:hypothetical protein EST38_g3536 [Candolleomyces aberdarensis]|uniref:Ubiquitin-like domain-containing protein n=1 Tax=Candolleomyces aberdarensis TaxID=2316362 RepID=A0A4Q2DQI9_9AGAR|nr:hypothetical protein EST38_g3536 [Candolleomyces aberdarensis]